MLLIGAEDVLHALVKLLACRMRLDGDAVRTGLCHVAPYHVSMAGTAAVLLNTS